MSQELSQTNSQDRTNSTEAVLFYKACQWLGRELGDSPDLFAREIWTEFIYGGTDEEIREAQAFVDRMRYGEVRS